MKKFSSILFLLGFAITCMGQSFTSANNGNWMNPTTWSPPGIPLPGSTVTIDHAVALDTSYGYTSGSITVNSGGSLIKNNPTRDLMVSGTGTFTNDGTTDIRYLLTDGGAILNSGDLYVKSFANYTDLTNDGSILDVDSFYNDGIIDNNGLIRTSTFYNDDEVNNYDEILGLVGQVDSMTNAGTMLNDIDATILADSCTNLGTFTNNGMIIWNQFTNAGMLDNDGELNFDDMFNMGTVDNGGDLIGTNDMSNVNDFNNQAGGFISLDGSFINVDTLGFTAYFTAEGGMVVEDSWYNYSTVTGIDGNISVEDTSLNNGTMSGSFDFCDNTPPPSYPFIDFQFGTLDTAVTFCQPNAIDELANTVTFDLYPNPVVSLAYVKLSSEEASSKITVYNILGEQVLERNAQNTSSLAIDLSSLQSGVYIMTLTSGNSVTTKKFVKK